MLEYKRLSANKWRTGSTRPQPASLRHNALSDFPLLCGVGMDAYTGLTPMWSDVPAVGYTGDEVVNEPFRLPQPSHPHPF